jgi:restriction system protein
LPYAERVAEHILAVSIPVAIALAIFTVVFIASNKTKRLNKLNCKRNLAAAMDTIDHMTGLEFERYIAKLLESQGYGAIRLTEKYDYGVDIIAIKDGITWGIQTKRYSGLVKASAVRQVVTALRKYHCDRAMVITNSTTYSKVARELAKSNGCVLVGRRQLVDQVANSNGIYC